VEVDRMTEQPKLLGRRGLLGAAAAGTALAAVPVMSDVAAAAPAVSHRRGVPVHVPDDHALHALRRLGYGPTPADLDAVRKAGVHGWLNEQLKPAKPDLHETLVDLMFPLFKGPPVLAYAAYAGSGQAAIDAYEWATLYRAMYSSRQVEARLTEVWLDHFNVGVTVPKQFLPWVRFTYDTEVIRPRAMGPFSELLKAVLRAPAMLTYLDQWVSTKEYPVENLAREDLELHTVGLGNFTEHDVKAYSKLLTGATINPNSWAYEYNPKAHYTGPLHILGYRTANRSANGDHLISSFAEYLAHRPATARNVARRLLVHYVEDNPSKGLVDRVARQYLKHHTDIAATLRYIVDQPEFYASRGRKVRRPSDTFAAAVRGLGWSWSLLPDVGEVTQSVVAGWGRYLNLLRNAGHAPGEWPAPNGYPQVGAAWLDSNTTLQTWRLLGHLTGGAADGPFSRSGGPAAAAWHPGVTYDGIIAGAAKRITGQAMRPEHRHAIAAMAGLKPGDKPAAGWHLTTDAAHSAIHFGIVASEYMTVR
jgi:hypothetical protein